MKRNGAEKRASAGMLGFGVEEPSFTANQISGCSYAVKFDRAKNSGKGKKFPSVMSVIGVTAANKIAATKVDDMSHYYVPNETARILYFCNRTEKNFTIQNRIRKNTRMPLIIQSGKCIIRLCLIWNSLSMPVVERLLSRPAIMR